MAVKGARKRGAGDRGEEPAAATAEAEVPESTDPDDLRRELLAMREEQARELAEVRALRRDLQEQIQLTHHLRETHLEHGARALERVQALTDRVDRLMAESETSKRNWRQSSEAAAMVVGRLETRMDELAERMENAAQGVAEVRKQLGGLEEGLPERLAALESRVSAEGLADRVTALESRGSADGLTERLDSLEALRPAERLDALESGLPQAVEQRLSAVEELLHGEGFEELMRPVEEKLEARHAELRADLEAVDFSALTHPLEERLQLLAEELERLRAKGPGVDATVLTPRLERLERDFRNQGERLDEELEALFEQNRLRVAEMSTTFDERMESLETAAARVREVEEAASRSRIETGQVLQAAFERLEALTGQLGRLEDQVVQPLPEVPEIHALKGSLEVLQERLQFLESRPLPQPMDPEAMPRTEPVPPEEGLSTPEAAMAPPADDLELRTRLFDAVERMVRDLELRVVEQSLEALTESNLLRGECERLASDLAVLSERLGKQFAAIWGRLQEVETPRS